MQNPNTKKRDVWHLTCDITIQDRKTLTEIMNHLGWTESRCVAQAIQLLAIGLGIQLPATKSAPNKKSREIQRIAINLKNYKERT